VSRESSRFLRVILEGDRRAACQVLAQCFESGGPVYVYEEVVRPAMTELGEMWARDEVSIAQEHLATATADIAMAGLYPHFDWPSLRTSIVFVACPHGERHALGARMLADLLALDGWDEMYFGPDVPIDALAQKAAELRPRAVAFSVTITNYLRAAREAADAIRALSPGTKIIAGGRAVSALSPEHAAKATGSDIVADSAARAVEIIRDWR